jgi:hypothetical protein
VSVGPGVAVAVGGNVAVGSGVGVRVGTIPTASPAPRTPAWIAPATQQIAARPIRIDAILPPILLRLLMSRIQKRQARMSIVAIVLRIDRSAAMIAPL